MLSRFDEAFYNQVFADKVKDQLYLSNSIRHIQQLSRFCVGSVLDMACGLGQLSNYVDSQTYLGIDFSTYAITWAIRNNHNPHADFYLADLSEQLLIDRSFDTVVLSEILEHVDDPGLLVDYAKKTALQRIIIALPINMPMEGHIKGIWSEQDIKDLFGNNPLIIEQGCPTPKGKPIHWHAVYKMNNSKPIQDKEIVRFVHNPIAPLPDICLPDGYQMIRVETEADKADYLKFISTTGEFLPTKIEYYSKMVVDYSLPGGINLVKYQGKIIACNAIVDFHQIPSQANLTYFYVHPNHRKKGIGTFLFVTAIKQGYKMGYRSIRFITQTSRRDAISLYETLGFIRE